MFRFETCVIYVSKTRFCFRWKKQQNNYVIQNHVPDSHKRNAPQESLEVCPITKYKSRVYLPVVAINKRQTNEASTKDLIMKGKPVITTYVYII